MPIKENGPLKLARLLLSKPQVKALEHVAEMRSNEIRTVSISEAAREVVAAGLGVILPALDSDSDTSVSDGRAA